MQVNRRYFLRTTTAAAAACVAGQDVLAAEGELVPDANYRCANADWLAKCRFGIGTHWTAQTVPRSGPPKPFQVAVEDFDLDGFIRSVEYTGADYVLFTSAHALQLLPAPHPVLDRILSGRTCKRDLIMELADALVAKGKHLIVYYNHSCNHKDEQVVGYVQTCNSHQAPMTFNVGTYQHGTMAEASVEQLHRLNRALRS